WQRSHKWETLLIEVGKNFTTGRACRLEALPVDGSGSKKILIIGSNVQINDGVHITATVSVCIGNYVLMASKVYISDVAHGNYDIDAGAMNYPNVPPAARPLNSQPVVIEDNVWLGDGVCVLPGITIGKGSIIGANAVVTKNIPAGSIAVGIPAKIIKRFDEEKKQWLAV
ncbi:MAG: DapH/DapD/GlmU-related protein, partial [Panacibacter sp.]